MLLDGRMEKRVPAAVRVHVASLNGQDHGERTFTENVSLRGAQLITEQPWRPNEEVLLTFEAGQLQRRGRVVYCRALGNGRFCMGLELRELSP